MIHGAELYLMMKVLLMVSKFIKALPKELLVKQPLVTRSANKPFHVVLVDKEGKAAVILNFFGVSPMDPSPYAGW